VDRLARVADAILSRFEDRLMKIYLRGGPLGRLMKQAKTVLQSTPSQRELSELFSRRAIYTAEKARHQLGYNPRFDLERGLKLCALWLVDGGFAEAAVPAVDRNVEAIVYRPVTNDPRCPEPVTVANS
jgi:hypothetical protein